MLQGKCVHSTLNQLWLTFSEKSILVLSNSNNYSSSFTVPYLKIINKKKMPIWLWDHFSKGQYAWLPLPTYLYTAEVFVHLCLFYMLYLVFYSYSAPATTEPATVLTLFTPLSTYFQSVTLFAWALFFDNTS